MDKIKLFDTSAFDIEDGASLDHVTITTKSAAKAAQVAATITPENLAHVEFLHGEEVTGIYNALGLTHTEEGENNPAIDGKKVIVSLCQM